MDGGVGGGGGGVVEILLIRIRSLYTKFFQKPHHAVPTQSFDSLHRSIANPLSYVTIPVRNSLHSNPIHALLMLKAVGTSNSTFQLYTHPPSLSTPAVDSDVYVPAYIATSSFQIFRYFTS